MANEKNKGIIFIIMSAACFAVMNLFVKLSGDLPTMEKSLFRNLVAACFAFFLMYRQHISFHIPKGSGRFILIRSIAGTIGIFTNFYAVSHLPISDASMLNKLSPFFSILFSFFLLKEMIKPYQMLCVAAAFAGTLFILKPGASMNSFPALIGVLGGLTAGLAYTYVRIASKHGAPGPLIVFYFSSFSTLCSVPFLIRNYVPMSPGQLFFLLMAGVSAAGGQFSITAAYSHAPASEISVYDYSQVLFAALLGMIFLGEFPDIYSILGYIVIIGSGVVMFIKKNK